MSERLRMTIVGMLLDRRPTALITDLISEAAEIEKWVTTAPQRPNLEEILRKPVTPGKEIIA